MTQRQPLAQVTCRIGDASCAGAHASRLNRATAFQPGRSPQSLLQLQRQYGNRYVQRVLALAREGEGEAEAAPEVEAAIQRARGAGQALDSGVQNPGAEDEMDQGLTAPAFTSNKDVSRGRTGYDPGRSCGWEFLADEVRSMKQQVGRLQRKLTVSQPGDQYEQEADRVMEQVMRMPEPRVRRTVIVSLPAHGIAMRRVCTECKEQLGQPSLQEEKEQIVQAEQFPGQDSNVAPELEARLQNLRGCGQPLPESVRSFFEPRFGYDFSQVRVHTDTQAGELARAVSAQAFTLGRDIVFGSGEYAPETTAGKRLLAHELTHTIQQGDRIRHVRDRMEVSSARATPERETGAAARAVMARQSFVPALNEPVQIARQAPVQAPLPTPPGPTQPAPTPTPMSSACCCCADSIAIANISRIDNAIHMGHSFDVVISLSYPASASKASCTLEWWEKTNIPYAAALGQTANTWHDMFALIPSSPTLSPWVNRREDCLTNQAVTITDPPALGKTPGRTVTRTLEFRILINSRPVSPGCGCGSASQQVTAKQVLKMVNATPDWASSSFTTP